MSIKWLHVYIVFVTSVLLPSVLWCCWLGSRKGIWPVKKLSGGVLAWLSVRSEVQTCIWPSWCHCHSLFLASAKSRFVLPFWYRLTRVVPDKGPLNGCVCVCVVTSSVCLAALWQLISGLLLQWKRRYTPSTTNNFLRGNSISAANCSIWVLRSPSGSGVNVSNSGAI